jgi:5-hydroxyisourate hydrolase
MVGGLSIHCVDVARGRIATGLRVSVCRLRPDASGAGEIIASGLVGLQGLMEHPALMSEAICAGGYEVCFDVGGYYRQFRHEPGHDLGEPGFLEMVPYRFHISCLSNSPPGGFRFSAEGPEKRRPQARQKGWRPL